MTSKWASGEYLPLPFSLEAVEKSMIGQTVLNRP